MNGSPAEPVSEPKKTHGISMGNPMETQGLKSENFADRCVRLLGKTLRSPEKTREALARLTTETREQRQPNSDFCSVQEVQDIGPIVVTKAGSRRLSVVNKPRPMQVIEPQLEQASLFE